MWARPNQPTRFGKAVEGEIDLTRQQKLRVTISAGLMWDRLRQGVRWHDGQNFTSADVAASLAILKKFHPRGRSTFAHLAEVQTPDDHTVVLQLNAPIPYLIKGFPAAQMLIIPRHVYDGTDPFT